MNTKQQKADYILDIIFELPETEENKPKIILLLQQLKKVTG